jgi:hypothetical protein
VEGVDAMSRAMEIAKELWNNNFLDKEGIETTAELIRDALKQERDSSQLEITALKGIIDYNLRMRTQSGIELRDAWEARDALRTELEITHSNWEKQRAFLSQELEQLTAERDAMTYKFRPENFAQHQCTECGKCGKRKHTPWRDDAEGYGYVCATCLVEIYDERNKAMGARLQKFADHVGTSTAEEAFETLIRTNAGHMEQVEQQFRKIKEISTQRETAESRLAAVTAELQEARNPDIPLSEGVKLFNGGVQCDMLFGVCSCGATHAIRDTESRFKQIHDAAVRGVEIYIRKLDTTQRTRDEALAQRDALQSQLDAMLRERNAATSDLGKAVAELRNIANANPREWAEMKGDFQVWAQSRARHTLAAIAAQQGEKPLQT